MLKFYVLFAVLFRAHGDLIYAKPGQNVTLPCFFDSSVTHLRWYKQVAGEQPQIIVSVYKLAPGTNKFHNQFKDNKRFSVHTGEEFYHLNISNVQDSDSAMYYCGLSSITITEFERGIFLVLNDASRRSVILQPASDLVQPGGSVTLNCTFQPGTCDRQHRVYWFKNDSSNSHMGIMYIHAHSSSRCGQNPRHEPPEQKCMYSLSKRNVSESDAGMYYCAVAHCGHVLFGKGTRLDVGGKQEDISPVLLRCVAAALLLSLILNIILICIFCKVSRKLLHSRGLQPQSNDQDYTADSQNTDEDAQQYVALDFKKRQSKTRRQRSTEEETIYSGVRLSN